MAFAPLIVAGISAVGAVYSAQQQSQAQKYRAQVDEQNATLTRQQTNAQEEVQRRQMAQALGANRAAAAETGFDPQSGTLLNLQTRTAGEMELDVLTNRYRGELEAIGLESDARIGRSNASATMTSGYLSAAGYLASGSANYLQSSRIPTASAQPVGRPRGGT